MSNVAVGDMVTYTDNDGQSSNAQVTRVHDTTQRSSLVDLDNGAEGVPEGDRGTPNTYASNELPSTGQTPPPPPPPPAANPNP